MVVSTVDIAIFKWFLVLLNWGGYYIHKLYLILENAEFLSHIGIKGGEYEEKVQDLVQQMFVQPNISI